MLYISTWYDVKKIDNHTCTYTYSIIIGTYTQMAFTLALQACRDAYKLVYVYHIIIHT